MLVSFSTFIDIPRIFRYLQDFSPRPYLYSKRVTVINGMARNAKKIFLMSEANATNISNVQKCMNVIICFTLLFEMFQDSERNTIHLMKSVRETILSSKKNKILFKRKISKAHMHY